MLPILTRLDFAEITQATALCSGERLQQVHAVGHTWYYPFLPG
jgi:hypothetical protein